MIKDPLGSFLSPMTIREVASDGALTLPLEQEQEQQDADKAKDASTDDIRGVGQGVDNASGQAVDGVDLRLNAASDTSGKGTFLPTGLVPGLAPYGRRNDGPEIGSQPGADQEDDDISDLEPVTWVVMGLRAQDRGEVAEALACFDNALELDRSFVRAWFHKGFVMGLMGQHREGLEAFRAALELDPKLAKAWNNMGVTHTLLEEHEEAVEAFERALELRPDRFETLYNLGISHATLNNHIEALEAFERALELEGLHHQAWFNRGMVLLRLGRDLEAVVSFDRALGLRPAFPEALVARGRAHFHAGDPQAARDSARKALEFDTAYGPAHRLLTDIDGV